MKNFPNCRLLTLALICQHWFLILSMVPENLCVVYSLTRVFKTIRNLDSFEWFKSSTSEKSQLKYSSSRPWEFSYSKYILKSCKTWNCSIKFGIFDNKNRIHFMVEQVNSNQITLIAQKILSKRILSIRTP